MLRVVYKVGSSEENSGVFVRIPEPGHRPAEGFIGLQNHPQGTAVYFREISVYLLAR